MLLTDKQRREIWRELMEEASSRRQPLPVLKDELLKAIENADQHLEADEPAYLQSLPINVQNQCPRTLQLDIHRRVVTSRQEVS